MLKRHLWFVILFSIFGLMGCATNPVEYNSDITIANSFPVFTLEVDGKRYAIQSAEELHSVMSTTTARKLKTISVYGYHDYVVMRMGFYNFEVSSYSETFSEVGNTTFVLVVQEFIKAELVPTKPETAKIKQNKVTKPLKKTRKKR